MRLSLPTGMKRVRLFLGAWTLVVMLFLYIPIAVLVVYSFNADKLNIRWEGFTLKWYTALAADQRLINSMKSSLWIALVSTLLSVVLGTGGAWLLYRYRYPFFRLLSTLVFVPMIVPEIIMGVSFLVFFATLSRLSSLFSLGTTTVIIAHTTFCFPFVMVAIQARLAGLDPALEEAAMDLGATPLRAFVHVIIPYLLPGILAGALMAFTLSMDELIVTWFTRGPGVSTLPVEIFGRIRRGLDPSLNAISTLFIAATAVLVVIAESIRRRA